MLTMLSSGQSSGQSFGLSYDVVDVFTDRPFAGNQLAVVHGAESLSTQQCLAIAQEFNYSETTFPVPVDQGRYSTRIFTPSAEIPFAGHPTLGTAWVLRLRGLVSDDGSAPLVQECGAGEVGVSFSGPDADAVVELSAGPRDLVGPLDELTVEALLADVGLDPEDLAGPVYVAGTGLSFVHLPVVEDAVARARVASTPLTAHAAAFGGATDPVEGINLVCVTADTPSLSVHARVFVPGVGVDEDPATGSAAAGLGMALAASGLLPDGGDFLIRQGIEMGRPSTLHGHVDAALGVPSLLRVAGQVRHVAHGEIAVPDGPHGH